jgi:hypothetical protein
MSQEDTSNLKDTRAFRVQAQDNYKIKNISLVSKYIVPKVKRSDAFKLNINGVDIEESYSDKDNIYFDFEHIRNGFRDLIPMTKEENDMCALETMLAYNALCAMNAYKTLSKPVFNNTIFTNQDLSVRLINMNSHKDQIEMKEEYYISDVHKQLDNKPEKPVVPVPMEQLK